jgi:hypothetical protein
VLIRRKWQAADIPLIRERNPAAMEITVGEASLAH